MGIDMELNKRASQLLGTLVQSCHGLYGFSSMTCAVYDTAWISMIKKPYSAPGTPSWLFPSSFDWLLKAQGPTGGWEDSGAVLTDRVLSTAAALLSLCKHHGDPGAPADLGGRIDAASRFLDEHLRMLDVSGAKALLPVAFELLLPAILDALHREGVVAVDFPARQALAEVRARKLARIDFESIYSGVKKHTVLHSLEACVGSVDFDRLRHQTVFGSMMASPSSTAAYLMNISGWDDESEAYLRHVVASGPGAGDGSVPSAFPSTYFELSWTVSTLLGSGFSTNDLGLENLEAIKNILVEGFASGSRLIGFAPFLEPDADDTAKGLTTLNMLGVPMAATRLIEEYSNGHHFKTYENERDASVTTNCNALIALCISPNAREHVQAIETTLEFLTRTWWQDPNAIVDKWHVSCYYPIMLMAEGLRSAVDLWAQEILPDLSTRLLEDVLIVLFQLLTRVMRTQAQDGSWDGKFESTAYAVLAMNSVASLPVVKPILAQVKLAMQNARAFLAQSFPPGGSHVSPPEKLWVEKVTYGSPSLSEAFVLAALKCSIRESPAQVARLLPDSLDAILQPVRFFRQLPLFSGVAEWSLSASLLEASLFQRRLRERCLQALPQRVVDGKEGYLSFIPFTWTSGNAMGGGPLGAGIMLEMMVITALTYKADEFIEGEVAALPMEALATLKHSIGRLFSEVDQDTEARTSRGIHGAAELLSASSLQVFETNGNSSRGAPCNGLGPRTKDNGSSSSITSLAVPLPQNSNMEHIHQVLKAFIRHLWMAPYVRRAADYDRAELKSTIQGFFIAHLTQAEANQHLATMQPPPPLPSLSSPSQGRNKVFRFPLSAGPSLFNWTRTTSGDHTAGPFAVAAFLCMLGKEGKSAGQGQGRRCRSPVGSPEARYIVQAASRHLAAMCRLYNDAGSMARDRAEDNLNSVNFPDFYGDEGDEGDDDDDLLKQKLLRIAEYERRCLDHAMAELRPLVDDTTSAALSVFCTTADMYGQMYVLKDLTARVRKKPSGSTAAPKTTDGTGIDTTT